MGEIQAHHTGWVIRARLLARSGTILPDGDDSDRSRENDGTLEVAQRIAGHADSRTTKLYDRRGQKVLLEDMERIRY